MELFPVYYLILKNYTRTKTKEKKRSLFWCSITIIVNNRGNWVALLRNGQRA